MEINANSHFVSIREFANIMGYHTNHVRRLVQQKKIPAIRFGFSKDNHSSWRIDLNQLEMETNISDERNIPTKKNKMRNEEKQDVDVLISQINKL